jgi:hypothetical protein
MPNESFFSIGKGIYAYFAVYSPDLLGREGGAQSVFLLFG